MKKLIASAVFSLAIALPAFAQGPTEPLSIKSGDKTHAFNVEIADTPEEITKGLAGRAGPKLPDWAKRFHRINHQVLQIALPVMVATGALAGLLAPFAIKAFGLLQINPAAGSKSLHDFAEEVHELAFNALLAVIVLHAIFHLWRHFLLKDNALRIMVPRLLHKYL